MSVTQRVRSAQHGNSRANENHGRRDFLKTCVAGSMATGALGLTDAITLNAETLRKQGKACILLWMQGGPSQFETWDPKPRHGNGGETKAIGTDVSGVQISENFPYLSKVMSEICLIRSMTSREGSHPRASFLMHTGYLPQASVKFPTLGAHVAYHLGQDDFDLPSFVRIGSRGGSSTNGGFLGVDYDPFLMQSATRMPENTEITTSSQRYRRRLQLMDRLEKTFQEQGGVSLVQNHRKLYSQASRMVLSSQMKAFDIQQESQSVRQAYGDGETAAGMLLARRLVESGVPFVEVNVGNWDTHDNNFERSRELCGRVDQPMSALIEDLQQRGMLERTLIVWAGEFGRSPRINGRTGRDHYPRAYCSALAGCGVHGGQVIGSTNAAGTDVSDRPVGVPDFFRTIYQTLGIDAKHEYMSNVGRPITLADEGEVVTEVFGGASS